MKNENAPVKIHRGDKIHSVLFLEQLLFQCAIADRFIGTDLGLGIVAAVGVPADGEKGRRLDALRDGHTPIDAPPVFEVGDEVLCRGEVRLDEPLFTANIGL